MYNQQILQSHASILMTQCSQHYSRMCNFAGWGHHPVPDRALVTPIW